MTLLPQGEEPDGESRYSLWSTRADGFVLEDATRADLREWAEDAPERADVPDVGELMATVEQRRARTGSIRSHRAVGRLFSPRACLTWRAALAARPRAMSSRSSSGMVRSGSSGE